MSGSTLLRLHADRFRRVAAPALAHPGVRLVRVLAAVVLTLLAAIALAGAGRRAHAAMPGVLEVSAVPCSGPVDLVDQVPAYGTDAWRVCFDRSGLARLRVRGDGDTDLDCFVYDSAGREVARDDDGTDFCVLDWRPRSHGDYHLEIHNLGWVYNQYRLYTR